ncbi:MarR family winged helix-turn-helix transcriptional regulator [Streptomyces cavernae]|uniref:MarR family winged helix-turn-helix transcriptional regulator n=1 Tax=Streptomyces cavernae TaxID=2259034 RepID=UPI000FEC01DE|nr:MarR family transcriptional regulator [Streptomyces cavernae]
MGCAQDPGAPDAVARRVVDAVEDLVGLWFAAVEDASPRLSARQLRALRVVSHRPELNLTALAEHLGIGLPTASRLCDRLEAAGMLHRRVQPRNRREVQLVISAQGRRLLTDVTERLAASLADILDALPPVRRTALEQDFGAFHEARRTRAATRPPRDSATEH